MKYAQTAALISGTLFLLPLLLSFALAVEDSRTADINTQCSYYMSSASDLVPDDGSRSIRLKNELSFSGGDWEQHPGSSPLMPFDDSDSWAWYPPGPEKLVGFDVIDVNPIQLVPNAVSLSAYLTIGIYRNWSLNHDIGFEPGFSKKPGFSTLVIMFEGVYVENGDENVLCLLGNSKMPSINRDDEPSSYLEKSYLSIYGSLFKLESEGVNDRVLLVLRYPQSFNLTSRAIKGEMRSFGEQGSSRYFNRVEITSQLRNYSDYSFSETVASRVCNDSLFRDEMIENGAIGFNASSACMILHEIQSIRFSVEPNVGPEMSRLGPFVLIKEKKGPDQRHEDFKLIFQSIRCEVEDGSVDTARVSAIVRAIPMKTDQVTGSFRTGISGATMSIEGSWNNELFCGVGCFEDRCDTQISFYFPRWLSVKQRNIVLGTISSMIRNQSDAYYSPLRFNFLAQPSSLMDYTMPCRYNYSMIDSARELWERRNQEFDFTTTIKKLILRYPSTEQLSFHSYVMAVRPHYAGRFMVQMKVLSLGPFCGDDYGVNISGGGDSRLVNLSIHLKFIDEPHWHFHANYEVVTDMFFDGVYDNSLGEMHLLGCAGSNTDHMDCLIEARLKYSPSNTQWLKHPIVSINVTSQRNITDPLRFSPVMLVSYVIGSDRVEKDLLFRVIFEGILRILVVSLDIGIVLSQFAYMNKNIDSIPQISLIMIGIQILGYLVPFIGGPEIAVPSKMSKSFNNYPRPGFWFDITERGTRFLLLVVISIMSMFFKRVKESRTQESTESSEHFTDDKKILLITSVFHTIGFAFFAAPKVLLQSETSSPSWPVVLKTYFYVIQTFFLVPQVIANHLSKNPTQAIRNIYTSWFVFSRLLLGFYDKLRDHVPYPTSWEINDMMEMVDRVVTGVQYEGDTVLTVLLVVAASILYVHHRIRRRRVTALTGEIIR